MLDGKVVHEAAHLRASDDPPSLHGATRGTRRYAYLSTMSKKYFMEVRGIRAMTRLSACPVSVNTCIMFTVYAFALYLMRFRILCSRAW